MIQKGNETGANRLIVRILKWTDSGRYERVQSVDCVARSDDEKVNQTDIDGLYDIVWSHGTEFGLYNESMYGELRLIDSDARW